MPPDAESLFTLAEVAKQLRMEQKTLSRLIGAGEFPRPIQPSPGIRVWTVNDVLYYRLRIELASRLRPARKKAGKPTTKGAAGEK